MPQDYTRHLGQKKTWDDKDKIEITSYVSPNKYVDQSATLADLKSVVGGGGAESCPEYQIYNGDGLNESKALNKELEVIPRLPTKTCYGAIKSICTTTWIDSSYNLNLSVLEEVSSDTLAEWVEHYTFLVSIGTPASLLMRMHLITINEDHAKTLIDMKTRLESMIDISNNEKPLYDDLAPLYDTSCIEKWTTSAQALKDAFTAQIVETEGKVAALKNIDPPGP